MSLAVSQICLVKEYVPSFFAFEDHCELGLLFKVGFLNTWDFFFNDNCLPANLIAEDANFING